MSYQKIVPHLWFDTEAMEAAEFYADLFPDSRVMYSNIFEQTPSGNAEQVDFEVMGYRFMGISAGPYVTKNPSISFMLVFSKDEQTEFQKIWETLAEGGRTLMPFQKYDFSEMYGWAEDKYGVSWQLYRTEEPSGEIENRVIPTMIFVNDNLGKAEEAMNFYMDIFSNSKTDGVYYYPGNMEPNLTDHIMHGQYELENQCFALMDSAEKHEFDFSEGVSLMVKCEDQKEIDYYWDKLSHVPESEQCGWLKDKYGVSWQILPKVMDEMVENGTPDQLRRVTAAFLKMKKFDVVELEAAYEGP